MAINAFQSGIVKVKEMRALAEARDEREAIEAELNNASEIRSPIREKLIRTFNAYRKQAEQENDDNAALTAWKCLVANDINDYDLGGYAFFLINWRIPMENDIMNHPEVIEIANLNPQLMNRSETKMFVNGKMWKGKH